MGREFEFVFRGVQLMPMLKTGTEHQERIGVVRNKGDLPQRQLFWWSPVRLSHDPWMIALTVKSDSTVSYPHLR